MPFFRYHLGAPLSSLDEVQFLDLTRPAVALMAAFFAVGQIQGVCDPTNTHNVWLATFTKGSTEKFLKRTIPYVWGFVVAALAYAALVDGVMSK